jgi:hypothetical protein
MASSRRTWSARRISMRWTNCDVAHIDRVVHREVINYGIGVLLDPIKAGSTQPGFYQPEGYNAKPLREASIPR